MRIVAISRRLGLAQCGEVLPAGARPRVRAAVERGLGSPDARRRCEAFGSRYLEETYGGGVAACVKAAAPAPGPRTSTASTTSPEWPASSPRPGQTSPPRAVRGATASALPTRTAPTESTSSTETAGTARARVVTSDHYRGPTWPAGQARGGAPSLEVAVVLLAEAPVGAQVLAPARAVAAGHRGVPAQAGDHRVGVAAVRVDRDPAALAALAPAFARLPESIGVFSMWPPCSA